MSVLSFSKVTDASGKETYEATIDATGAVNVHIERADYGYLIFSQRGTDSGEYATTRAFGRQSAPLVVDTNLVSDVYPMHWKIVSSSAVSSATLTEG